MKHLLTKGDFRGVAKAVSEILPADQTQQVAKHLWLNRGSSVVIATGFFVKDHPETDGPLGAIALGRALTKLGSKAIFVSRADGLKLLKGICDFKATFVEFPVQNATRSTTVARQILKKFDPQALIAIEVCGPNKFGRYWDMRGHDISKTTPRMDLLFSLGLKQSRYTVGIGDGGNEVGFGDVPPTLLHKNNVEPCVTQASALIVAAISNWGAYAVIYHLSRHAGRDLLPALKAERGRLQTIVANGAVDGFSGCSIPRVDGRSMKDHEWLLRQLRSKWKGR